MKELGSVFKAFDLDGGSDIGADELLALGKARRKLGQKEGEWTEEMNERLMQNMGAQSSKSSITQDQFVSYFHKTLSNDAKEFDTTISQFLDCAKMFAKKKAQQRNAPVQTAMATKPKSAAVPVPVVSPPAAKQVTRPVTPGGGSRPVTPGGGSRPVTPGGVTRWSPRAAILELQRKEAAKPVNTTGKYSMEEIKAARQVLPETMASYINSASVYIERALLDAHKVVQGSKTLYLSDQEIHVRRGEIQTLFRSLASSGMSVEELVEQWQQQKPGVKEAWDAEDFFQTCLHQQRSSGKPSYRMNEKDLEDLLMYMAHGDDARAFFACLLDIASGTKLSAGTNSSPVKSGEKDQTITLQMKSPSPAASDKKSPLKSSPAKIRESPTKGSPAKNSGPSKAERMKMEQDALLNVSKNTSTANLPAPAVEKVTNAEVPAPSTGFFSSFF